MIRLYVFAVILVSALCKAEVLGINHVERPSYYEFSYEADSIVNALDKEFIIKSFDKANLLDAPAEEIYKFGEFNDHYQELIIEYRIPYPKGRPKIHSLVQGDKAYWINSHEVAVTLRTGFDNINKKFSSNTIGIDRYTMSLKVIGIVEEPISDGGVIFTSSTHQSAETLKHPFWKGSLEKKPNKYRYAELKDSVIQVIENGKSILNLSIELQNPVLESANLWELPDFTDYLIVSYSGETRPGDCEINDVVYKQVDTSDGKKYEKITQSCIRYYDPH